MPTPTPDEVDRVAFRQRVELAGYTDLTDDEFERMVAYWQVAQRQIAALHALPALSDEPATVFLADPPHLHAPRAAGEDV